MFVRLGQLMAMALVHGGGAVGVLSRSVFNFISGMEAVDIVVDVDEVPEAVDRDVLTKVGAQILLSSTGIKDHSSPSKYTDFSVLLLIL